MINIDINKPLNSISKNTQMIQNAIDKVYENGGGFVFIYPGTYKIKTIFLKKNVNLVLKKGSLLDGSHLISDYGYPSTNTKFISGVGNTPFTHYYALIVVEDADNSSISGEGEINGNGYHGGPFPNKNDKNNDRPYLIVLYDSNNFKLKDVTLKDSAVYAFYAIESDNLDISGVKISTLDCWNGDGLDFDGCKNITIYNCNIEAGDDCISPKSYGNRSTENILINNCVLKSRWAAIRVGVESCSDIKNITMTNCVFNDCADGLKIQSSGNGIYSNFKFDNIVMNNVNRPFFITKNHFSQSKDEKTIFPNKGRIENIKISNITINETKELERKCKVFNDAYSQKALLVSGLFNNKIKNISFNNIKMNLFRNHIGDIRYDIPEFVDVFEQYPEVTHLEGELPCSVFFTRNVKNLEMKNIEVLINGNDNRPAFFFNNVSGKTINVKTTNNNVKFLQYKSNIKCDENIENYEGNLNLSIINAKKYIKNVKPIAKAFDRTIFETSFYKTSDSKFFINRSGKFTFVFSRVFGEFDLLINKKVVKSFRFSPGYKLIYLFACKINVHKGDLIEINYINPDVFVGHYGIYHPHLKSGLVENIEIFDC